MKMSSMKQLLKRVSSRRSFSQRKEGTAVEFNGPLFIAHFFMSRCEKDLCNSLQYFPEYGLGTRMMFLPSLTRNIFSLNLSFAKLTRLFLP